MVCSASHTHLLWNKPCSWYKLHYGQAHMPDTRASCQQPEKSCGWEVSVTGLGEWSCLSSDPHWWGFQTFRKVKISLKSIQLLEKLIIPIKWTLVKPRQGEFNLNILLFSKVKMKVKSLSRVPLFATPWTVACTRLLRPWDFLGRSTGVGCHCLLRDSSLCLVNFLSCSLLCLMSI